MSSHPTASHVASTLRRAGLRTLGSRIPPEHDGVRVTRTGIGTSTRVHVVVESEDAALRERLRADVADALTAAGYAHRSGSDPMRLYVTAYAPVDPHPEDR